MGTTVNSVRDFLIVGQGLAGTLLAHFLLADGYSVAIVDDAQPRAASRVAAGLINPITGRRFVKSWRIDDLLPFARQTYRNLEQMLGIQLYHERPIIRTLYSVEEENLWLERCADPGYQAYTSDAPDLGTYRPYVQPAHAFGLVKGGAQVDLGALLESYRHRWEKEDILTCNTLDTSQLDMHESGIRLGDIRARRIIFCEGRWSKMNGLFPELPLLGDKGEVLLVRFPETIAFDAILKHRVFVVPFGGNTYWIGSNYQSRYESDLPTATGRSWLEENLRRTLTCPFEVLEHKAAIRPTVRDRRPLLGQHSTLNNVFIFNGLGTKGTSLGPFWARHFADYLQGKCTLDPTVDIRRF